MVEHAATAAMPRRKRERFTCVVRVVMVLRENGAKKG
jgi:hypothetical protein